MSIDCKATVNIGEYSRGGQTRGDNQAADHDMGCEEQYTPFGIVDEDSGALSVMFGSSAKTSDFIVDSLIAWWEQPPAADREGVTRLQIKADNGPESNGRRTPFLKRIVDFADHIGIPIQLLYYRRTIANTTRSSGAGAFWKSTGMAPSSSTPRPCWSGRKA